MSDLTLGAEPASLRVLLSAGYPFTVTLTRTKNGAAEDWPSAPTLTFSDASVWTAAIAANVATFSKSAAEVDAKVALADRKVALSVGGVLWARGAVLVNS